MKKKLPLLLISAFTALATDAQAHDDFNDSLNTTNFYGGIFGTSKNKSSVADTQSYGSHPDNWIPSSEDCCVDMAHFYGKIFGGANFLQNSTVDDNKTSYDTGYIFGGSFGYAWRYGIHLEGEYAFRRNGIDKIRFFNGSTSQNGHFQTSSYMGNLLWYLPLCTWGCSFWSIQPLFGAGIGYDIQRMHASSSLFVFDQKWNHFSWQLIAGLAFPIFCHTEFTLEYKFHQGGAHFNNHSIGIGLAYKFGLK